MNANLSVKKCRRRVAARTPAERIGALRGPRPARRDSNAQPSASKADALSIELRADRSPPLTSNPTDSKSGALSIELRGRIGGIITLSWVKFHDYLSFDFTLFRSG